MDLEKLKNSLNAKSKAEFEMAHTVLGQLNHYKEDIKELASYCSDLVDSKGNKVAVGNFNIGLFSTHKYDWKGETNGIVYLNMLDATICIDIRDNSHDEEDLEYGIDIKGPALPQVIDASLLADCIADNNNFEMAMQATNPNTLIDLVVKNASDKIDDISKRIAKFE